MNFEEAFRHCQDGTATQEEREFIKSQIAKAKQAMSINFDEAFAHVQAGTATQDEIDYVNARVKAAEQALEEPVSEEPVRPVEAEAYVKIPDDAKLPPVEVKPAEKDDVKRARKSFKLRYVVIPLVCIAIVVVLIGAILGGVFGAAAANAKASSRYTNVYMEDSAKSEAVDRINKYCSNNNIVEKASENDLIPDGKVDRNFVYNGIRHSYYVYFYEYTTYVADHEFEIVISVNSVTGVAQIAKFDVDYEGPRYRY